MKQKITRRSFLQAAGASTAALLLAACSGSAASASDSVISSAAAPASSAAASGATASSGAADSMGKTLVIYFSATGTTEGVAQAIAGQTGADLFPVIPAEPYTSEDLAWQNSDSRVSREHNDESLRTVELESTTVENWADYDTVFLGYPIWWGIAAWPLSSFVAANDFTGKTVIPFCTSASSGLGDSGTFLAEQAGTGTWLDGQRFSRGSSETEIAAWIEGLEL